MTIKHPLATDYATEQPPARMVAGAVFRGARPAFSVRG